MTKQMKKILLFCLVISFAFFSNALATEISGSLGTGLDTGMEITSNNCNPLTVANGTVAPYPGCAITCNAGYVRSGNSCVSSGGGGGGGGGAPQGDLTAPSITDVTVTKTSTGATINWKTTEASWTWLLWGTTANYSQEVKTEAYVLTHSVVLSDLTPNTTYYFQIKTKDTAGNTLYGTGLSFKTSAQGSNTPVTETPSQTGGQTTTPFTLSKPLSQMSRAELLNTLLMLILQLLLQGKLSF